MAFADITINTGSAAPARLPCRGGGQAHIANFSCTLSAATSHTFTPVKEALGLPANAQVFGIVFSGGTALQVTGPLFGAPTIDFANQNMELRQSNNGTVGATNNIAVAGANRVSFTILVVF